MLYYQYDVVTTVSPITCVWHDARSSAVNSSRCIRNCSARSGLERFSAPEIICIRHHPHTATLPQCCCTSKPASSAASRRYVPFSTSIVLCEGTNVTVGTIDCCFVWNIQGTREKPEHYLQLYTDIAENQKKLKYNLYSKIGRQCFYSPRWLFIVLFFAPRGTIRCVVLGLYRLYVHTTRKDCHE